MPDSDQNSTPSRAVTRQELYDMAWRMPMLRVAERFGVSSSYLARVFTELRIPRPPPGYWAQVEFGKSPAKPSLSPARPGELTEWSPGTSVGVTVRSLKQVVQTGEKIVDPASAQTASVEAVAHRSKRKARVSNAANQIKRHELLTGVRPFFLKSRKVENDILRPFKRLLVDVLASEKMLDAVLDATQVLFDACVRRGHHVGIAAGGSQMSRTDVDLLEKSSSRHYHRAVWSPERPTLVHVGGVAIGLTVFEMTEEVEVVYVNGKYLPVRELSDLQLRRYTGSHHWRSKEEHASGRICLQAYCPSWRVKWAKRWPEVKPGTFQSMVPQIVSELEGYAPDLARQLEEARIQAEEEHRRWEEERRRREGEAERQRREKARQDAKRDLLAAIEAWDEARRIADFFRAAELRLNQGVEGPDLAALDRLRLAKNLIGQPDPLTLLKSWKAPDER